MPPRLQHQAPRHILNDLDELRRTATCTQCGPVSVKRKGRGWRCKVAERAQGKKLPGVGQQYRRHLKLQCERCSFAPEDVCQLDIHHVDGNHKNNNVDNLLTLCANCHRLVTRQEARSNAGLLGALHHAVSTDDCFQALGALL